LRERLPMVIEDKDAYIQSLCGAFKVPTLRNVALTAPYMHNGVFANLRDVVEFYATRDTNPGKWYPHNDDGSVIKFNDLPPDLHANVNTTEAPLDRRESDQPRMNDAEIDAVVAFLLTLTDGYKP
jgi:cytochrome c peroxidase